MVVIEDKAKEDIPMRPPNINDEPPHLRGFFTDCIAIKEIDSSYHVLSFTGLGLLRCCAQIWSPDCGSFCCTVRVNSRITRSMSVLKEFIFLEGE